MVEFLKNPDKIKKNSDNTSESSSTSGETICSNTLQNLTDSSPSITHGMQKCYGISKGKTNINIDTNHDNIINIIIKKNNINISVS